MSSPEMARRFALVTLIAATGCGDDDGDDDTPRPDGNVPVEAGLGNDAGGDAGGDPPIDGGSPDGGGGSIDGGTLLDAQVPVPDGGDELSQALNRTGVRTDDRRAVLVFGAACAKRASCDPNENAAGCSSSGVDMYRAGVGRGFSAACLDATLDLYSCFATISTCDFDQCESLGTTVFQTCPQPDAGG